MCVCPFVCMYVCACACVCMCACICVCVFLVALTAVDSGYLFKRVYNSKYHLELTYMDGLKDHLAVDTSKTELDSCIYYTLLAISRSPCP